MAVWQFDLKILPVDKVLNKYKKLPTKVSWETCDEVFNWKDCRVSKKSLMSLENILSPQKSWSKNIKQYGNTDETCVKLFFENNSLLEVSVRLDIRSVTKKMLFAIVYFAEENHGVFVSEEEDLIEPSLEFILKALKSSKAYLFVEAPDKFFEKY